MIDWITQKSKWANRFTATVDKIIKEVLQQVEPGMVFAKETRDLLTECCVEFITLVSSEANEIAEKDAKKTIACEHVVQALDALEFKEYIGHVKQIAKVHKTQQQVRTVTLTKNNHIGNLLSALEYELTTPLQTKEKKQSKIEQSGMTEEELIRQQQELFRSATDKFNAGPQ